MIPDRPVLEVRAVLQDGREAGSQATISSRVWRMDDDPPKPDMQPWMVDPRRSWPHPQDPIILSFLVAPGDWETAVEWVKALP